MSCFYLCVVDSRGSRSVHRAVRKDTRGWILVDPDVREEDPVQCITYIRLVCVCVCVLGGHFPSWMGVYSVNHSAICIIWAWAGVSSLLHY